MNKEILKGLADNPALMESVKELILTYFSTDKLDAKHADDVLGQMVRARLVGIEAINQAFKEIAQYRSLSTPTEKKNPAI